MPTERLNYNEQDWRNPETRLAAMAEMASPTPLTLSDLFKVAMKLLYAHTGAFHFDVGWDWNFQACVAHVTTGDSKKFYADGDTPEHALMLVLELWLERRGTDEDVKS